MYFNPLPLVIRKIRDQHELTQTQLAEKLGVKQGTISAWENGKTRPNRRMEQKIFKCLQTTDAEIGAALYEIVGHRFGYDRSGPRPPAPPPRRLARVEALLEEVSDSLSPEALDGYEKDVQNVRNLEGLLKQLVWTLEDKLTKEAEKAGKRTESPD